MRCLAIAASLGTLLPSVLAAAETNLTSRLVSRIILPNNFKPPQVFKNTNLLRNINLQKGYPHESINVVIENTDSQPQDEYFLPFEADIIAKVGALEVRDKKEPDQGPFDTELVEYDPYSLTQFYRIRLPKPLQKKEQQTLAISYSLLAALTPLPARINQSDKQYLVYTFSAYAPSAYPTSNQKTKIKFPSDEIPDYTKVSTFPEIEGTSFTYGPFKSSPAGASEPVRVRYEFTKPIIHASLFQRDIEVSHWGGNLATEERVWLENIGAHLDRPFARDQWMTTQYYNPSSTALRELRHPLPAGAIDPYFVDDIGNVSTSRFSSGRKEANVDLKPRYPVFGGWKYNFKLGWDVDLKQALRKVATGDGYILKVPFLGGVAMPEGTEYERVEVRVILPEGAKNIKYETPVALLSEEFSLHKTFMDTLGRSTVKLTAQNVFDSARDKELIVTYDYPFILLLRKPLTIFVGLFAVFTAAWAVSKVDTSIGKKR